MIEYENLKNVNLAFLNEIKSAISRVVDSGWFVLGGEVKNFESEFANYLGAKYCIGVANGLDALTLSLTALDLPASSEVIVASNTYIATILAIIHAGHKPVLVEPCLDTYNIDSSLIEKAISPSTKAICITHLYGKPCDMDKIMQIVQKYNLHLIEDCAQSHGARFEDKMTGTFGIAGCFSFYPTKNLGAMGDAGAIVTNNKDYAEKLQHLRNYGSNVKYVNKYVGYNSRLDEMQAAILRVKLPYLESITDHKRKLAAIYIKHLPDAVFIPVTDHNAFDVFHIFSIRTKLRNELKEYLLSQGIKTEIHYPIPPHKQEAMSKYIFDDFPIADEIHKTELSLPISLGTSENDVLFVCEKINNFFKKYQ
ncbi:MAG: DegT/DnrJ/EryC1/StrS family aminotransferase [Candidatus Dependentiae bacterium]|nr:DegT/DnrJ/EryC1/StrS family aminotransferase [Candidatus Dependentiae bacterium]